MSLPSAEGATPALSQWFGFKAAYPDGVLFFRMGDFFEMFFEDAKLGASLLDLQVSCRQEHAGQPVPMCGIPAHAHENYLARLIRRGHRVVVVDQVGVAKKGKGVIDRRVSRIVTPGTLTEDSLLDAALPSLLLALAWDEAGGVASPASGRVGKRPDCAPVRLGAAWLDLSTGLFETLSLDASGLPGLLGRLDPAELLLADAPQQGDAGLGAGLGEWAARLAPAHPARPPAEARRGLAAHFGPAEPGTPDAATDLEAVAACLALDYVAATQMDRSPRLSRPTPTGGRAEMAMDAATRASLELVRARDGGDRHTLLGAIARTVSAAGRRLLAEWLQSPLLDPGAIGIRQDRWAWLLAHPHVAPGLRGTLRGAPDMARALSRLALGRCLPRDLAAVRAGLAAAAAAAEALAAAPPFAQLLEALSAAPALRDTLDRALAAALPARAEEGGAVAPGYDGELDAQRRLRDDSRRVVAGLQLDYAQRFGVASLKIRHHQQLGYVIEAPAPAAERLRAHPELQLRQGMANGARFTHPELSELDRRIAEAAERAQARERAVLEHLVGLVLAEADAVAACGEALAELDVACASAELAADGAWRRPVVDASGAFRIVAGRHPVVEAAKAAEPARPGPDGRDDRQPFVANDCDLSAERRVMLLTGPNMAGKSTYLRQNALIAVLAQAGLPVPAKSAHIGVVDRLFSRVGAADDLARGRSTFMVEMTETAAILHRAGSRALVVVDEIGRGTGTLDGLAIAWAVLEALHFSNQSRVIFATHFHELAELRLELPRLRACTMRVCDWQGGIRFLHEIEDGAAGRSWGVHVAQLAGTPAPVVRRASQLLATLEAQGRPHAAAALPLFAAASDPIRVPDTGSGPAPGLTPGLAPGVAGEPAWPVAPDDEVRDALSAIDPDRLTPREALDALYRLKSIAGRQDGSGIAP